MALGSTQPLTEMSTRNISWGLKVAGAWGWQPYHLHVAIALKSGSLNLQEPSGPVQACNGIALPLPWPLSHTSLSSVPMLTGSFQFYPFTDQLAKLIYKFTCTIKPTLSSLWFFTNFRCLFKDRSVIFLSTTNNMQRY